MERSYLPTITEYIRRPRIDSLIRKGLEYSLVYVVAGPGYGKTLAVAHYIREADIRLVWLRASATRTSAADFWEDLVKATRRELPEYAAKLEELGFPDSPAHFERFREIAGETAAEGRRLVLVIDNYERILNEAVTRFVNNIADSDLPNATMFILCNVMLPFTDVLPTAGMFRITNANLAFTLDEARLMYQHYGIDAPESLLERAVRVTGGWPLGLRLVCESSPENPEEFSSRSPVQMTADLYEQHYYSNYPKDVQVQLVLFSLLPQFSLDMAADGLMATSLDDFGRMLMRHPFVSFDYKADLFTFQAMYHDFLRIRLPLLNMELRRDTTARAGRWFLLHDMAHEAMDCFWEASDYDGFLEAVALMPKVRHQTSLTNQVLQRLEQVPGTYADTHPEVDFSIAFMYLNAADIQRARELLLSVMDRLLSQPDSERKRLLLGDTYAALADISTYLNEDTGLEWMKKAYEQVPHGSRVHIPELLAVGNHSAFFLPDAAPGRFEQMVDYFFEYAKYADKVKNGCGHGNEYLFAGEAAFNRAEMDRAAAMFNSAMLKAQHTGQHDIICNALWGLGRIELYYGNHKNALALLGEIINYVDEGRLVGVYELRDCAIAYFYLRLDDLDKVPAWLGEAASGPEPTPINVARKLLMSACYLHQKGEGARGYAVLLQLESLLENRGRWPEKLSLYLLKAQHLMGAGDMAGFAQAFKTAYDMVYANDLKLSLAVSGRDMMTMLDCLKRLEADGYDWAWLDLVYQDASSFAKRLHMMREAYKGRDHSYRSGVALTKREDETLRYLAQGLTQKEVGRLMGISENAVKKHISKIYFKLGAVNRADAIHIATVNGLVDVLK